jgi:hypothetical protein
MQNLHKLCIFLLVMMVIACSSDLVDQDQESKSLRAGLSSDEEKLRQLKEQILLIIADKSCTGSGTCKAIGFGAKPCGGPSGYLIYNSGNVDESLLIEKVDEFYQLNVDYNIKTGAFSDCAMVNIPDVDCVAGQCAAVN